MLQARELANVHDKVQKTIKQKDATIASLSLQAKDSQNKLQELQTMLQQM